MWGKKGDLHVTIGAGMPALVRKRDGLALNDFETFAPPLFLLLITPQYCKCNESKERKQLKSRGAKRI
jgi:hypothetical protein